MKKPTEYTPTMTHEIALKTTAKDRRLLRLKFRGLRELYNTLLGFLLKQDEKRKNDLRFIQNCRDYCEVNQKIGQLTRHIQRLNNKKNKTDLTAKERSDTLSELKTELKQVNEQFSHIKTVFNELADQYNLTFSYIEKMATRLKNSTWMRDHLDGDTIQVLAKRVFRAYFEYKTGKRGKPRFKSWKNGIRSIEGKKNACISITKHGKIRWKNLDLSLMLDRKDKDGVQAHALNSDIKFCRIVCREIKGCQRYFVQLVLKNTPLLKEKNKGQSEVVNEKVGIDLGVSSVAVSSDRFSGLLSLGSPHQRETERKIARLQRKLARSARSSNPDCFEKDILMKKEKHTIKKQGKNIKGKKYTHKSKTYLKTEKQLKELQRKNTATKTQICHILANQILGLGGNIQIEKNNFKALQRGLFGKSLNRHSPSKFQEILLHKAEKAGGNITFISPFIPCFSQYCHRCQQKTKKPLSQRLHTCCQINIQRDVYSAFLIRHYDSINEKHTATATDFQCFVTGLTASRHLPGFPVTSYIIREENPFRVSPSAETLLPEDRKKPDLIS